MFEFGRGVAIGRCIRIAMLLAQRGYTVHEVAVRTLGCECDELYNCKHRKMVRRDISSLEESGIPIQEEQSGRTHRYSVDAHFMKRFM